MVLLDNQVKEYQRLRLLGTVRKGRREGGREGGREERKLRVQSEGVDGERES